MRKNEQEGIWIPKELYLVVELSLQEKILFMKIISLDDKNGCFASNNYLAQFLGINNVETISKMISKLVKLGLVSRDVCNGGRILHTNYNKIFDLKQREIYIKSSL